MSEPGRDGLHRQQRDGAARFTEWLSLPQMCILTGRALFLALDLSGRIDPDPAAMARSLDDGTGPIRAEEFTFALARHMPRPEAQARLKELCTKVAAGRPSLPDMLLGAFPDLASDLSLAGGAGLGAAPDDARAFAAQAAQG